jgi:hypothetical protein
LEVQETQMFQILILKTSQMKKKKLIFFNSVNSF